ncbi:myosin light chain kinase, smooth muscle-like isoform X2 [Oreochromis aureus]|uniref:myosin light chain kinase, smooth muscle-like isoform X2 n=1 Tax=Oreochromis aureus TaxID=47969 RepID=UPI001952D33E|nr:myosin light chain kinase, smooth muscle-like isoform X2 [Oreochromis aureus]
MFKLNRVALLFIRLLVMWHVFGEIAKDDHRALLVSTGDSVMLTCNISEKTATLITWTNNRSVFQYSIVLNRCYSNFSFHRLKINHEFPTELIIFSAQPEDEGLYTCSITDRHGINSITWNLTVSENPKEILKDDDRAMLAFRGDSVMLTCNISEKNATLITWTNSRSVFHYSIVLNRTHSNFSFHRHKINHEFPTKLIIFSAQPEDEGLYTCKITDRSGLYSITWNLTVSENREESTSSNYFLHILPPAIGFLLCCITLAVFLYRSCTRTLKNSSHDIRTLSFVWYHVQLGGKVVTPQPQSFAVCRTGSTLRDSVQSVTSSVLTRRKSR